MTTDNYQVYQCATLDCEGKRWTSYIYIDRTIIPTCDYCNLPCVLLKESSNE